MKVCVTGGAGFIGRHLVKELKRRGREVWSADLKEDLTEHKNVEQALQNAEYVYHLAAHRETEDGARFNVLVDLNVLETAKQIGVTRLVYASSARVYEPVRIYDWGKYFSEKLCMFYRRYYPITIIRFHNVYGPEDKGRVVPDFIEKAMRREDPFVIKGNSVREFVWVGDAVNTVIDAAERGIDLAEIHGERLAILDLAKEVTKHYKPKILVKEGIKRVEEKKG